MTGTYLMEVSFSIKSEKVFYGICGLGGSSLIVKCKEQMRTGARELRSGRVFALKAVLMMSFDVENLHLYVPLVVKYCI